MATPKSIFFLRTVLILSSLFLPPPPFCTGFMLKLCVLNKPYCLVMSQWGSQTFGTMFKCNKKTKWKATGSTSSGDGLSLFSLLFGCSPWLATCHIQPPTAVWGQLCLCHPQRGGPAARSLHPVRPSVLWGHTQLPSELEGKGKEG